MSFSEAVLERFIASGMSQGELSRLSGVERNSLRRWINGAGHLSAASLDAVVKALGLSVCLHEADAA